VERHRRRELVRYGLVGAFNAGTYFALYAAGVLAGVPYVLAAVVAFLLSACLGYWLHEHWTFGGGNPTATGMLKWIAAQSTASGMNIGLLVLAVDVLGANKFVAQLLLLPLPPVAAYLVGRRFVFTRAAVDGQP
jgi:putative flippase GtrA